MDSENVQALDVDVDVDEALGEATWGAWGGS